MKCSQVLPDFWVFDNAPELAAAGQFAGVADLSAHLGVDRRLVSRMTAVLSLSETTSRTLACDAKFVVADELRGRGGFDLRKRNDFFLLRGAGAGALLFHQLFKAFFIHGQAAFARHQLGEVERETVGVVKFESELS